MQYTAGSKFWFCCEQYLISEPIASLDGVVSMPPPVIHTHITKGSIDPSLCCHRVRPCWKQLCDAPKAACNHKNISPGAHLMGYFTDKASLIGKGSESRRRSIYQLGLQFKTAVPGRFLTSRKIEYIKTKTATKFTETKITYAKNSHPR